MSGPRRPGRSYRGCVGHGVIGDATWQLARLPLAPEHSGATPADIHPFSATDTSSITKTAGSINGSIRSAIRCCTG